MSDTIVGRDDPVHARTDRGTVEGGEYVSDRETDGVDPHEAYAW